jgi:hypothetical protein
VTTVASYEQGGKAEDFANVRKKSGFIPEFDESLRGKLGEESVF